MKKQLKKASVVLSFSILFSMALMPRASAYLDPAATSYLITIVSSVVISLGVVVGVFWKKIRMFFKNISIKRLERKLTKQADKRDSGE